MSEFKRAETKARSEARAVETKARSEVKAAETKARSEVRAAKAYAVMKELKAVQEFKSFILRGNMVDLAIGVVIGAAFGTVVTSLVDNIVTPLTGVAGKLPNFSSLSLHVGYATIKYGAFVNALLAFLIVALVVFFVVVKPLNKLMNSTGIAVGTATRDCPFCMTRINAEASRCPACTSQLKPGSPTAD